MSRLEVTLLLMSRVLQILARVLGLMRVSSHVSSLLELVNFRSGSQYVLAAINTAVI